MALQYLQETTKWEGTHVPNHTYVVEDYKVVAYVEEGTNKFREFSRPLTFARRGRTFKTLTKRQFDALTAQ